MNKIVPAIFAVFLLFYSYAVAGSSCADHPEEGLLRKELGSVFTVTLEANPTTGYRWEISSVSPEGNVAVIGSGYSPSEPQLPGSGGLETWYFKADKKGRSEVYLKYSRPWEPEQPPAQERRLRLFVY
jgi:inhibitor of cysteine peptidase